MINALFASQPNAFQMEGISFGWQVLSDMYQREFDTEIRDVYGWYHDFVKFIY